MLRRNEVKRRLGQSRPQFGLINSVPAPLLVEMLGYAGYDFVVLDQEHTAPNPETLENLIRAAEACGVAALVRVPGGDPGAILRALDAGALGIMLPQIGSAAAARAAVAAARYHPLGHRGISGGRTTGFGTLPLADYFALANQEILVAVTIENREGVDAIDSIASVPGVDLVIEGAVDLSQSLGVPGNPLHASVQAAVSHVADRCAAAGVPFCAVPRADGQLEDWLRRGVTTFLTGDDRAVAFRALKAHVGGLRRRADAAAQGQTPSLSTMTGAGA